VEFLNARGLVLPWLLALAGSACLASIDSLALSLELCRRLSFSGRRGGLV